jgi:hypothetical protein
VEGQEVNEYYTKLEGQPSIFLLKSDLIETLQKPLGEYTDSKPFSFLKEGSCEIHWNTEAQVPCVLKRLADLFLISNGTFTWQAENHLSRAFLLEIQNIDLTKKTGTPMSDRDAGLENPWSVLVVRNSQHEKKMFFGKSIEGEKLRWAKFELGGLAYPLEESVFKYLELDFEKLAAKNPMDGHVLLLKQVIFDFHEQKKQLVFHGEKTQWYLEHPYAWIFPSSKAFNYILKFVTLEVSHFRMGNLENPVLTATFEYKDPAIPKEKVEFYRMKENPDLCYVQRNGMPTLAEISASTLDGMSEDPFQFVAKNAMELAMDKSVRMVIRKTDQEFLLQKNNLGIWQGTEHADTLLSDLRKLECYSSMLKKDGVDFGFANPVSQITFFGEDNKKLLDCKIGSYSSKNESFFLVDDLFFLFVKHLPETWITH